MAVCLCLCAIWCVYIINKKRNANTKDERLLSLAIFNGIVILMYIVIFWGMIKCGKEGETDVIVAHPLHTLNWKTVSGGSAYIRSMDVMELWQHSVGS